MWRPRWIGPSALKQSPSRGAGPPWGGRGGVRLNNNSWRQRGSHNSAAAGWNVIFKYNSGDKGPPIAPYQNTGKSKPALVWGARGGRGGRHCLSGRHAAAFACGGLATASRHVGPLSARLTIIIGESIRRMTFCAMLMPPPHQEGEIRARGERGESPKALPGAVASIKRAVPRGAAEQGVSGPAALYVGG